MQNKQSVRNHTISVLVNNEPGVLAKLSGLITRRGFNIESVSAGDAKEKGQYRLTIVVKGDDRGVEQVQKQIYKMIDTIKVSPLRDENRVEAEMALIKVKARNGEKLEIIQLVNIHNGYVLDSSPEGFVVSIMGQRQTVDRFINLFPVNQVVEIARTGSVAMTSWE
jgi:acetolactate synthase-1/3 small subunit